MRFAAAILFSMSLAAPAAAQDSGAPPQNSEPRQPDATLNVDRLPLNLNRIQRELNHTADLEQREGLNLRYQIQIYGTAPAIDFFGENPNLATGPVPYGAPTHREMINQVTPQEFRAPPADLSALIRWLAERKKKEEQD